MAARSFRFGHQIATVADVDPVDTARTAEESGFDIVLLPDHVGPAGPSPMVTLGAIAQATSTIRLGTFVLNSDMRNPVQLAWEATTLDRLSGGRFELGLGAGHTPQEYAATGIEMRPAAARKAAMAEAVEIIRRLLDGDSVTWGGEVYRLTDAQVAQSVQDRLPILVGGNGAALLAHAGEHADIIGLQGLGRTRHDGHTHDAKWDPSHLDHQVEQIRRGAGDRFDDLELNALVQFVDITDDAGRSMHELSERHGFDVAHLAEIPYVLIGTVDEIVEKVVACRGRWGITYFAVRDLERFAPVIAACRDR